MHSSAPPRHDGAARSAVLLGSVLLAFLLTFLSGICSATAQDRTAGNENLNRTIRQIALAANRFRMLATPSATDAVSAYGIEDFPEKWEKTVESWFKGDEWQLAEFFAYSLIMIGSVDSSRCVVAFYNPWVDGVLLTAWKDRRADGWKATDFRLCLGETLRGEKPDDSSCPVWLKSGKPIAKSVIEACEKTVSAFQKYFPLGSPFQYPVIAAPPVPDRELSTLRARMKFSLAYLNERMGAPERRKFLDQALLEARGVLARGDKSAILALTSKDQDPYVAETICMLPQNIREGFVPHWAIEQPPMIAVVLSNAEMPRRFVLLFLDSSQEKPIRALGLYDFENVGAPLSAPAH